VDLLSTASATSFFQISAIANNGSQKHMCTAKEYLLLVSGFTFTNSNCAKKVVALNPKNQANVLRLDVHSTVP